MPTSTKPITIDKIAATVAQAATKSELTGTELAEKVNKKLGTNYDGRGIGRGISAAVAAKKIRRVGPRSRPRYVKV